MSATTRLDGPRRPDISYQSFSLNHSVNISQLSLASSSSHKSNDSFSTISSITESSECDDSITTLNTTSPTRRARPLPVRPLPRPIVAPLSIQKIRRLPMPPMSTPCPDMSTPNSPLANPQRMTWDGMLDWDEINDIIC